MIEVFIDAACRGNGVSGSTGASAIGIVIYRNRKVVGQYSRPIGERTSNEAEYEALIHSLFWCWSLSAIESDFHNPTIYTDSMTVHRQVTGAWNCKSDNLLPLLAAVLKFKENNYHFRLEHVPRKVVAEADTLANMILDDVIDYDKNPKG